MLFTTKPNILYNDEFHETLVVFKQPTHTLTFATKFLGSLIKKEKNLYKAGSFMGKLI